MNFTAPQKLFFLVLASQFLFLLISCSQARELPNSDSLKEGEALQGFPSEKVNLKGFGDPPPDPKGKVNLKGFGDPPPDPKGKVNLKVFGDPPPDTKEKLDLKLFHTPPTPSKREVNSKINHPPPTPPKANTSPPKGPLNR